MIALTVQDVSLEFGMEKVLDNVTFSINDADRVGIVGVNGAGKTSLLKIICGKHTPTGGAVYIQKGHTVGILEQNPDLTLLPEDLSCLEYMYTAFDSLLALEKSISRTELELAAASTDKDIGKITSLTNRLNEENRVFAERGGLEFRSRCHSMLLRLGFDEGLINQKINTLSGGQYTRLSLARLLATEPDILLLDEPTNHLDIDSLTWLEEYISSYKKTVLIVSHDRYFLDRTTNKTLHIQNTRARLFNGSYSVSREQQQNEAASLEKRYKEQQKEIAKIKANIEFQRRCNREHNFVTIRSKEKQIARMEKIELPKKAEKEIRLSFNVEKDSANDVLSVSNLSFSYGTNPLIKNLSFLIRRYERVFFLGPNGCGKSTLMKIMNSIIQPTDGKFTLGYNIKIGYYDQENRGLTESKTVFEEMHDEYPLKTDFELRSTLALFLFGAEDIEKKISTLSGGERARLTLAKLILKKVNLLIMDEPTNHLDIGSCEALENALLAFDGTIIAVSHDRYFINKLATRIIELDKYSERGLVDYSIEEYDDAFGEYLRKRALRATPPTEEARTKLDSKADYERKKQLLSKQRSEEKKIEKAKLKIPELESELEELDRELFGEAATNYVRAAEIDKRKYEIEEELLELYELVM